MAISLLVSNLNGRGKNSFTACKNAHKTRETAKYGKNCLFPLFNTPNTIPLKIEQKNLPEKGFVP